jgi:hypothetical protein
MTTAVGLNRQTLSTLVDWEAPLLVSTFVPVDFSRPQPTEPTFRALRRLAQIGSARLVAEFGLAPAAASSLVAPMLDESILDGVPATSRGLAVFLSADREMHFGLPITVGPAIEIGDRLDILRLLPAVVDDVDFFALTIAKKGARLFRGSRFEFEVVAVPDMPDSMEDALWYIRREPIRNRQVSGVSHGAGGGEDLRKDDLRQYIHLIDKALTPVLRGVDAPLVVIGVEYEASMFINNTHYRHTVDVPVQGSPESMPTAELHRRALAFVESRAHATTDAVKRLDELAGTGKTATDPIELVTASQNGLVSELLVARSVVADDDARPLRADERPPLVTTVNECLRHRATIHIVDDHFLPNDVRIAAILRY